MRCASLGACPGNISQGAGTVATIGIIQSPLEIDAVIMVGHDTMRTIYALWRSLYACSATVRIRAATSARRDEHQGRVGRCGGGQQLVNSRLARGDPHPISRSDHGASGSGGCVYFFGTTFAPRPPMVMSAIENGRTAALGSHVVRREDCSHG